MAEISFGNYAPESCQAKVNELLERSRTDYSSAETLDNMSFESYCMVNHILLPTADTIHIGTDRFAVSNTDEHPLKFDPAVINCLGLCLRTETGTVIASHINPYDWVTPLKTDFVRATSKKVVSQVLSLLDRDPFEMFLVSKHLWERPFHGMIYSDIKSRIPNIKVRSQLGESLLCYPQSGKVDFIDRL